ncbi:MAG: FAD-dependent oxidoreductase [Chloroflexota bacterium]|nr:FAD-dependent oxidoreductase [Chloroflexota bacterium]
MEGISFNVTKAVGEKELQFEYDLVIIGGGPAGLTAAIYASRSRMRTLLVEKEAIGGEAASTSMIENYPGFPEGIGGAELAERMRSQAQKFGAQIVLATPESLDLLAEPKEVGLRGQLIRARSIIIASGTSPRKLGIPGEKELKGKGVSYCATCDGPMFAGKDVAIVGCGNSGLQEGLFILKFVKSLTMVEFLPTIQAEQILQENVRSYENVRWMLNHETLSINAEDWVESITVKDRETGEEMEVPVEGVFIYVGLKPNSDFLTGQIELNEWGFIPTNERMQTSVPGVYAAGDIRVTEMRQVATAIGDGAVASFSAYHYVESKERKVA